MADGSHHGSTKSWVAVIAMVAGFVVMGVAMIFASWITFWIGLAVTIIGGILGVVGGLMDDHPPVYDASVTAKS